MVHHRDPADGLVRYNQVEADYFDDGDRDAAVGAGVRLVNALLRFGVNLEQISAEKICHNCTHVKDPYRLALGILTVDETNAMAAQLESFASEFGRMRELLVADSPDKLAAASDPQ